MRNLGAYWMLLGELVFLVDTSCAKLVPIPETDYKRMDARKEETYRLTTRERLIYEFKRFAVTDSTLVILEVKSYGDNPSLYDASKIKTPVVVPWRDVQSLERLEYSNVMTAFAFTGGVTAAAAVLFSIVVAVVLSSVLRGLN